MGDLTTEQGQPPLVETANGVLVVTAPPNTEIDVYTTKIYDSRISEALGSNAISRAVIDISQVSFLDSTGVHMLVSAHKQLEALGGQLYIDTGENERINKIMRITGLHKIFKLITGPHQDQPE